ncbi:MAG: hypothetical protein GXP42_15945 [Chloroflexi bacterium]|nr:hypothetical protein [Chloroflexota bacterium]
MSATKRFDLRYFIRAGLLAGIVPLYTSVIGMVEVFNKREVVKGMLTLGEMLVIFPSLVVGYLVALKWRREGKNPFLALVGALIAGFVASLPTVLLILVNDRIPLRDMFVNVNPALMEILLVGQEQMAQGAFILMSVLAVSGLLGAVVSFIPYRFRRPLVIALVVVILSGLLSEFIKQVLQQFIERGALKQIVQGKSLTTKAAAAIFVVTYLTTLFWDVKGQAIRTRYNAMPASRKKQAGRLWKTMFGIFLLILPWVLGPYLSEVIDNVGLYIIMGLGLNIAVGWAGLLDLGYVTNFAVGAYIAGVLTSTGPLGLGARLGTDPLGFWIIIPISILAAMFTGFVLALPVLRMRGDYLAIATLGFGEIIRLLALSDWLKPYIGGAQGILFIPKPELPALAEILNLADRAPALIEIAKGDSLLAGLMNLILYGQFSGPQELYYIIFVGALFVLFVATRLNNSRTGRQWMAMREDEDAASSVGINTTTAKVLAFTVSAASGGMAGAIFASKVGTIFPNSFNLLVSINVLSLIIIGGMGSIPGIVVGSLALIGLPELLREFAEFRLLLYGALLVVMMLVRPEGLWPSPVIRREMAADEEEPPPDMGEMQTSQPMRPLSEASD